MRKRSVGYSRHAFTRFNTSIGHTIKKRSSKSSFYYHTPSLIPTLLEGVTEETPIQQLLTNNVIKVTKLVEAGINEQSLEQLGRDDIFLLLYILADQNFDSILTLINGTEKCHLCLEFEQIIDLYYNNQSILHYFLEYPKEILQLSSLSPQSSIVFITELEKESLATLELMLHNIDNTVRLITNPPIKEMMITFEDLISLGNQKPRLLHTILEGLDVISTLVTMNPPTPYSKILGYTCSDDSFEALVLVLDAAPSTIQMLEPQHLKSFANIMTLALTNRQKFLSFASYLSIQDRNPHLCYHHFSYLYDNAPHLPHLVSNHAYKQLDASSKKPYSHEEETRFVRSDAIIKARLASYHNNTYLLEKILFTDEAHVIAQALLSTYPDTENKDILHEIMAMYIQSPLTLGTLLCFSENFIDLVHHHCFDSLKAIERLENIATNLLLHLLLYKDEIIFILQEAPESSFSDLLHLGLADRKALLAIFAHVGTTITLIQKGHDLHAIADMYKIGGDTFFKHHRVDSEEFDPSHIITPQPINQAKRVFVANESFASFYCATTDEDEPHKNSTTPRIHFNPKVSIRTASALTSSSLLTMADLQLNRRLKELEQYDIDPETDRWTRRLREERNRCIEDDTKARRIA